MKVSYLLPVKCNRSFYVSAAGFGNYSRVATNLLNALVFFHLHDTVRLIQETSTLCVQHTKMNCVRSGSDILWNDSFECVAADRFQRSFL